MNKAWFFIFTKISVSFSKNALADLDNYGCWCFTDEDYKKGQGEPVDEFDKICKNLHDQYDLIQQSNMTCSPSTEDYQSSTTWTLEEISEECRIKNPNNDCAVGACIAEGHFMAQIFNLLWTGQKPEHDFIHTNGFFPEEMCLLEHGEQNLESVPIISEMQYGCYCRSENDKFSRIGDPVDGIDTACKYYQEKLVEIESLCGDQIVYKSNVVFHGHVDIFELEDDCESNNKGDSCKISKCKVEGEYILNALNFVGLGDDSPINYTHFSNNGFDTMKTCAGLDYSNFKDIVMTRDRTIRADNQFSELCVVNSMQEYNSGDKLVLTYCENSKFDRMKFMWKHDSRTGLIRSIGSVQKNRFFQLCWSVEDNGGSLEEFEQVDILLKKCDSTDLTQYFEINESGVIEHRSGMNLCLKVKNSLDSKVVGMACF